MAGATLEGVVWRGSLGVESVAAYSADGVAGCSGAPKVCTPLWTTDDSPVGYPDAAVGVAGGLMYRATGTQLRTYDATGERGCSGVPKVCAPLWSATIGGNGSAPWQIPPWPTALSTPERNDGTVKAFDATGTTGCAGTPKVGAPYGQPKSAAASTPSKWQTVDSSFLPQ